MFSLDLSMEQITFVKCTILVILGITFYMFIETDYINDVQYVRSNLDNMEYLVRNKPDSKEAADMLSTIRTTLTKVVDDLLRKFPKDDRVKILKSRYNPYKISESPPDSQFTSYSINKGEKIVFCLRSKEDQRLHDINTMTFVALHELAHLMTNSIGHTAEFWDNFRFILKTAIQKGHYHFQDFKSKPIRYCGTNITDSPLKDDEIHD